MTSTPKRLALAVALALTATLAVGVATAGAHGGPGGRGLHGASTSKLVTEAAKQLGVSRTELKTAITNAAISRIDEAVEDEDIEAAEARDNLDYAYALSTASKVASNLKVTTAKLNTEFREAREAIALARIDAALKAGDIDEDEADELKEELEDARLPGYKPARGLGLGGPGHKGRR